jgi:hypothetical protein
LSSSAGDRPTRGRIRHWLWRAALGAAFGCAVYCRSSVDVSSVELDSLHLIDGHLSYRDIERNRHAGWIMAVQISHNAGVVPFTSGSEFIDRTGDQYGQERVVYSVLGQQSGCIVNGRPWNEEGFFGLNGISLKECTFTKNETIRCCFQFSDESLLLQMRCATIGCHRDQFCLKGNINCGRFARVLHREAQGDCSASIQKSEWTGNNWITNGHPRTIGVILFETDLQNEFLQIKSESECDNKDTKKSLSKLHKICCLRRTRSQHPNRRLPYL